MDIEVKQLSVTFHSSTGSVRVLRDVSLLFHEGEITALVGESGSGKSILGTAIMRLLPENAKMTGSISYDGKELLQIPEKEMNEIRGNRIGWIAQDPISAMDPLMRVGRQVTEILRKRLGWGKEKSRESALAQLEKYGLADPIRVYSSYPHQLSGGMAQRVMAAMMTLPSPEWLIADEPTKGLDPLLRKQVADMFLQIKMAGRGMLLITHDLALAERLADRVVVLYAGEILEQGSVADIFKNPQHPYTRGLLAAAPSRGLHPIPGNPPDLSHLEDGCIFRKRCALCGKGCEKRQTMRKVGEGHFVKCGVMSD